MSNPFMKPLDQYQRDLDLRKGAVEQIAKYASLKHNLPFEQCLAIVKKHIGKHEKLKIKDRPIKYYQRVRNGQREPVELSFLQYLDLAIKSGRILAPSLTIYRTAEEEKSVMADWLDVNILGRKKSKKEMLRLTQIGEMFKAQLADYDQNARKIRINAVSGMLGFKGCPLFMHTGHSALTTTCRAAAGYGNATVERFLGGARHYSTPEIAKANLVAVLTIEDKEPWGKVMEKYKLHYPTPEEVYAMVDRSSSPYWRDEQSTKDIVQVLTNMTPLERAIVLYSGDFYHTALYNEAFAKKFIEELIVTELDITEEVDTLEYLKTLDSTECAYVFSLNAEIMQGTTIDIMAKENPEGLLKVGRTAKQVKGVLAKFYDFINCFFVPSHLPPSVGNIRDISRTTGIIADTDSTIFTCQWWVEWVTGHSRRGYVEDRVWYMATYAVCQCIAHNLALMSANIGVERKFITRLAMKNEYGFPVLMNTNMSKTYSALLSIREGNVYKEYEQDLKGVTLRGSTAPKVILDGVKNLAKDIMLKLDRGEEMYARDIIKTVAEYELSIIRSVLKGEYTYLRTEMIKPEGNKLMHYDLWKEVFAVKYGNCEPPPIPCVKVSLDIANKSSLKEWIDDIEDKEVATNLKNWMIKNNRDNFGTVLLPIQVIKSTGLPVEIAQAANIRKLAYGICSGFYAILEACGLFIVDRENHRLAYEYLGMEV